MWDAAKLAQEVFAGQGQPGGELGTLQRAARAAAEPLSALGQSVAGAALGYLGSSTAVALASGLGVLRLGLGAHTASPFLTTMLIKLEQSEAFTGKGSAVDSLMQRAVL